MIREMWGCGLFMCVFFGRVGPKGERNQHRKDDYMNIFRPILAKLGCKGHPKINNNMKEEKTPTQRTKFLKHLILEMWGDFLKNGGLDGCAFTEVLIKTVINILYKT